MPIHFVFCLSKPSWPNPEITAHREMAKFSIKMIICGDIKNVDLIAVANAEIAIKILLFL